MQKQPYYERVSIGDDASHRISLDGCDSVEIEQGHRSHEQSANDVGDCLDTSDSIISVKEKDQCIVPARTPGSKSALWQLFLDCLLVFPGLAFIIYAIIVCRYDGTPLDTQAVSNLRAVAKYGPTIFPIAFSAVMASLLKSVAAWKLERGITMLNLQFLLSCRTVFSSITSPLTIQAINLLTGPLIAMWLLSPLGGQAALRVVGERPSTAVTSWSGHSLEFMGPFKHRGPGTSAGVEIMPSIAGAFMAALFSPGSAKRDSQDSFGNVKIPILEQYNIPGSKSLDGGWYEIENNTDTIYSSLSGLNILPSGNLQPRTNYSFTMSTSYMRANCSLNKSKLNWTEWSSYMEKPGFGRYHDGEALVIDSPTLREFRDMDKPTAFEVIFTSWAEEVTTNATCRLYSSYVEVDIACRESNCRCTRIRKDPQPRNSTLLTVLDNLTPSGSRYMSTNPAEAFFMTLVNVTRSAIITTSTKRRPSTLTLYLVSPDSPYSGNPILTGIDAVEVWRIGEKLFSERFTQLLNTYWLNSIAPLSMTGNFTFVDPEQNNIDASRVSIPGHNITGTMVPDILVLRASKPWLVVLFTASFAMLLSAIIAALLGTQRRGPEILDYMAALLKDNPYAKVELASPSMEDGPDRTRKLKDVVVCVGDAAPQSGAGYVTIGTVGEVMPLARQSKTRVYN